MTQRWQNMHEPRSYSYFTSLFFDFPVSGSVTVSVVIRRKSIDEYREIEYDVVIGAR